MCLVLEEDVADEWQIAQLSSVCFRFLRQKVDNFSSLVRSNPKSAFLHFDVLFFICGGESLIMVASGVS